MSKKQSTIGEPKKDQIKDLENQIKILKAGWQRTQADFENFQKRTEDEKLENMAYAKAEFMTKITPVMDNFRRAFEHVTKKNDNPVVLGLRQIEKQLEDILNAEGLEKISTTPGTKFDPQYHEAISYEENDLPAETIIDTLESGWKFENRVLKPSKVRVSKGK